MRARLARPIPGRIPALVAVAVALIAASAAGAASPSPAPSGIVIDPVLPVAGSPFAVEVDFSRYEGLFTLFWCYWRADVDHPPVAELVQGTLRLYAFGDYPPIEPPPCRGAGPVVTPVVFSIPAGLLAAGTYPIEVRERTDALGGSVLLATCGVEVRPASPQLELQDGRFLASVTFVDPRTDTTGTAHGFRLSEESGSFWFFDGRNAEVLVKLLDAGPVNDHFWLFAASLTTLDFTLTIEDHGRLCGEGPLLHPCPRRSFHHAAGESRNILDFEAFPAVPAQP